MGEKQSVKATKICDSSIYLHFFQSWVWADLFLREEGAGLDSNKKRAHRALKAC